MSELVCGHCGQELKKASNERKIIKDELSKRQDKLDDASAEMLKIIKRIEEKVGADEQTLKDIKDLELKIRAKVQKQYDKEEIK